MADMQSDRWRIRPGRRLSLAKLDTESTAGAPGWVCALIVIAANVHRNVKASRAAMLRDSTSTGVPSNREVRLSPVSPYYSSKSGN